MANVANRAEMPFLDHLEELRWRMLKSLLAVAAGTAVGWFVVQELGVLELLKRPIAPFLQDGRLAYTSPTEPLMLTLKLAFAVGLLLSSPIMAYQGWAFLAPALYDREKRTIIPAFTVGIALFLLGAAACYLWVLPAALRVLFGFQTADLLPFITIDRYFSFAIRLMVAFGVVAELPLVITVLAAFGLVTPQFLVRHRRYAIVSAAMVSAFLTPPDALSMLMMLVPMLLLYEVSIFCAWIVTRRRARAEAAAARSAALVVLLALGAAGAAGAQVPQTPRDTGKTRGDTLRLRNRSVDTATARRMGLPTGPTRTFPESDPVMDSLLKLSGYSVIRYVAKTFLVEGDSETIYLRGEAFVDRDGSKLEADSIRYHENACRLDAEGDPKLFDQGTVLVGEGMRYDTCVRRGTVRNALTDFEQGGATWFMTGNLAIDSASTRLYGGSSDVTTCEVPVPHYHFAAREVKWINKNVMIARPVVLYIRDVPILWLPFMFNDIRSGRRSGILVPSFGLNDLIRTSRGQRRHIGNLGYYWAINDYADLRLAVDWTSGRTVSFNAGSRYRWLDRFVNGSLSYSRLQQLDAKAIASHIVWTHQQSFDSRTQLTANVNYNTNLRIVPRNTIDPNAAAAQITSNVNFNKRFAWGSLAIGGSRTQNSQNDRVSQVFPNISLTPAPIDITSWMTWSPGFSLNTSKTFKDGPTFISIPGETVPDTQAHFHDTRTSALTFQTPLRIGGWNLPLGFTATDRRSTARREVLIPDSTVPGGVRRVLYGETFSTEVAWDPSISLPNLFSGTWKISPSIGIANKTSAGPFMVRNQFSGGEFVQQGKRLTFSVGSRPALFGFFPGFGPLQRIRHAINPSLSYTYAPGAAVSEEYRRAIDPERTNRNAQTDPQQTISFGLSQNFDAKLRPAPGDTASAGRKIKLLSINTTPISYNIEQAKQPGFTGWTTPTLGNSFASDLLPGFTLSTNHDLWVGAVGTDTARFDPFLQSVNASFSVTPNTLRGMGRLFGLGRRTAPPAPPPADTTGGLGPEGQDPGTSYGDPFPGMRNVFGGGGGGEGFSMQVTYSSQRSRPLPADTGAAAPAVDRGQQSLNLGMSFQPTPNWRASWNTIYDVVTGRFAHHTVTLNREMHRWQASFGYLKSAAGGFAFTFNVSLKDQPDIKFDYDQQTFPR